MNSLLNDLVVEPSQGVVVAVSGGADSVAMVRLLSQVAAERDLRLSVAHLDHGARGEASREDAAFVADLAESLSLPFDLGRWSATRRGHFEADARSARYAWLAQIARDRGASLVAVGHTRDDQAETILHRIVRGTGLRGLSGMPRRRKLADGVTLVRPLLNIARSSLRDYLFAIGQTFREDASNADLSRTRNRIRHDLLPRIAADYNPRIVEALTNLGRIAGEVCDSSEILAESGVRKTGDREIVLIASMLHPLPMATRGEVVRIAWRRAGWPEAAMTARHWTAIAELADRDEGRITTAYAVDVVRLGDEIRLSRAETSAETPQAPVLLAIPGSIDRGSYRISASIEPAAMCEDMPGSQRERIDLDRLSPLVMDDGRPALEVRSPRDGDRFDPLGLDGHEQSLNDFFRGRGVARDDRASIPLVCDAQGIVWVVGHRIAHRVRITPATRRTIRLASQFG